MPVTENTYFKIIFIILYVTLFCSLSLSNIINYPRFCVEDNGIYQHAALQYKTRPKVNPGIAVLSLSKLLYPHMQPGIANLSHAQHFWLIASV